MTLRWPGLRVRWVILTYLFGFAFVAFMQRISFSVAAAQMMPELGLSQMQLGSAAATPMIAFMMQAYGWKNALIWTTLPALLLIALWGWYGRDKAAQHAGVSAAERAELKENEAASSAASTNRHELLLPRSSVASCGFGSTAAAR